MTPTYTVLPYEPGAWPDALRRTARPEVLERWGAVDRSPHAPRLVAAPDGGGTALVTARPGTAYVKIVDAVGDVPAAVGAVLSYAYEQGLAQVKWEGWTASAEDAAAAGFAPLRLPLTRPDVPGGPGAGYVRWLVGGEAVAEPPYYRQSTHFTCGAVTALVAQAHTGVAGREPIGREAELTLWRAATNFPACEPVGLGVAVRRRWPSSDVEVLLDTDKPVLLDHLAGDEREWRAVLQRVSRTEAGRLGVPVDGRRLSLPELRDAVGRGECVLLLVSLAVMQGFDVPHWVLCHGAVPGAVVVGDPWFNTAVGETWVDAHLLPVADGALDAMSPVGQDRVRGAVRIGGGRDR
ncbi:MULTISPECIES: peptidase C39 family protein [unclassified Streptomyces]|uniref:peptidase C39 family protein n=1 Tax=unclassified Streptomyces TaxID=2593676 RepID=UPI00081E664C|nr:MULTISPECIES: peptidase C39 family protein [unclassified Streptomyces]MYR98018.1 acetyltransferase [Streptomyces sp. SID4937]SCE32927.1 Peptidase_C39 like family protein [Streptomyces sp. ScaeMP-e83]